MNPITLIIAILLAVIFILFILLKKSYGRFDKPDGTLYIDTSDAQDYLYRLKMNDEVDKVKAVSYVVLHVDPTADLQSLKID